MTIEGIDVFTGDSVQLSIEGSEIVQRTVVEAHDLPYLSPGWLDLQVNGWAGLDWNGDDLSLADAERLCNLLAARGTTRFFPTIITAPQVRMVALLERIRTFCERSPLIARSVGGIHVEGPCISAEDGPRGAHNRQAVRDPEVRELDEWIAASGNRIRIVTLAPERSGSVEFIAALRNRGIVPAIGHTAATRDQIRAAVAAGARFSTHLGNGLADTIQRHSNPLWPQLADDTLMTGIVADGFHLPKDLLRVIVRAKGADRVIAVSDAAAPGGTPPGRMRWSGIDVEVSPDGRIGLADSPYLAGAGHLQDRAVATLVLDVGLSVADAVGMVSVNPRRLMGERGTGSALHPGSDEGVVSFRVRPGVSTAIIEEVVPGPARP